MTGDIREPLEPSSFERDEHELARDLLGQRLVRTDGDQLLIGRIVETEVYGGTDDPASHADSGEPTERTRSMFAPPGTVYVYDIWGWSCLNITAPGGKKPAAILIRALEPLRGLDRMAHLRDATDASALGAGTSPTDLVDGPGKVCEAMAIDEQFDGRQLPDSELWIAPADSPDRRRDREIDSSARIGLNPETVGEAAQWPWRYVLADSDYLSR